MDPKSGFIYCCKKGQTLEQRKAERALIESEPLFDHNEEFIPQKSVRV